MKNKFKEIEVNINPQGVCEITLNRPDKHNAMSRKMIDELEEAGQYVKIAGQCSSSFSSSKWENILRWRRFKLDERARKKIQRRKIG